MRVDSPSHPLPADVESQPCDKFELDLDAATFNMCKRCQLPKSKHVSFNRQSNELKCKLVKRDAKMTPLAKQQSTECCDNFRRDLSGTTFDTCVCGFPKTAHEIKPLTTGAGKELKRKLDKTTSQPIVDDADDLRSPEACHCDTCTIM